MEKFVPRVSVWHHPARHLEVMNMNELNEQNV